MKILAIESSGQAASVALVEDEILRAEFTMNQKKTHSQTLLPMLEQMSNIIELDFDTIDAIAVSGGPGSFTGLRIGAATAKGLGLAWKKPLICIPTVDGLAFNMWGNEHIICPLMDARRNQTYTGLYKFEGDQMQVIEKQCAVGIEEIIQKINALGQPVVFLGDGVKVFRDYIKDHMEVTYIFAPAHKNEQQASSLATLGISYLREGKTVSAAEFQPDYLRLSQAERERNQKLAQKND